MPRKIRTVLLALAVVLVLATLTVVLLVIGQTPPRPPLPNPNGYDDFLKAGALSTRDTGDAPALDQDKLRALVSTNSESLRLLRLGLTRECALPADSAMTNVSGMLSQLADLKRLAQLLAAEGRLYELDGQPAAAARSYVDAIHFGNQMSRGGFIINRLVGIACESIGQVSLSKLMPKLGCEEARLLVAELEKIDAAAVTWEEVRKSEKRFAYYQLRQTFNPFAWVIGTWQSWGSIKRAEMKVKRVEARRRLLIAELAVRCYQSEQGRAPTGLEQLTPKYLQKVPMDPFSGQSLAYRPNGTNWLLYSIGEDGVDDGGGSRAGRPVSGTASKGDIFYDSP